ncbi:FAD:protein FMN transferase [Luteitalea sp.]|uniref:FAD:protein FMN transferase n=1 Tax=Luteitalea sp. TaxID=2004800 RepID=UPI0037C7ADB3
MRPLDEETSLRIEGRRARDARRHSHEAMHTVFEVHALHPDARYAAQAAEAAFAVTDRLERDLSRFIANSDISRINRLEAGEATRVCRDTLECLVIARHMFELTDGAFDISIGTGLSSIELDEDASLVRATRAGVRLDLGGIGKGYAVDRMADVLEDWGLHVALVHGGFSSVLALDGPEDGEGWPLTLSDPASPARVIARLSACQTSLGASGVRKGDHIVDPRTGEPVRGRRAAWVSAPRPAPEGHVSGDGAPRLAVTAVTDALTTACMLMGLDEIEALCARSPGLEAWVLEDHGQDGPAEADLRHVGGVHNEGPAALQTGDA